MTVAEMKRKWGQVISGVQSWLSTLNGPEVLVSFFMYDSQPRNVIVYKTPEEMGSLLSQGLEVPGSVYVSLPVVFKAITDIIERRDAPGYVDAEWLHYAIVMTVTDFDYPGEAVSSFAAFRKLKELNLFFNAITQLGRNAEMTKVATALDGVHYSIRKGANFTTAFIEAMERDPFKGY